MPVYTYQCDQCGFKFDHTQKFTDPHLTVCPHCNQEALRKVFVPVSIVFKGKGFYATDNRSPSGQHFSSSEENSAGKTTESGSEKKAEVKTEAKTESKTESKPTTASSEK